MKELVVSKSDSRVLGAVIEDGKLVEVFSEDYESIAGNIYLGRVERIIPGLDGAFVNIGTGRNAFLRLRDVSKSYLEKVVGVEELKEGMKLLVQVKKDATKMKGPQVTTKISVAGRYVVYFPVSYAKGVSRRVSKEERSKLLLLVSKLRKKGEGIVIRTAAEGVEESYIEEELEKLRKEWKDLLKRFKRSRKPKLLRKEPSVEEMLIRDRLDKGVDRVYTNDPSFAEAVRKASSVYGGVEVKLLDGDPFQELSIYEKMEEITKRIVHLDGGAFIVIDTTEAMTVIDVNSASFTSGSTHRELVLQTNIQAAREIARQIRLRNIGGIIVVDFITMDDEEDRRKVIEVLKEETRKDRSRVDILGFTRLGLLEMTRKRTSRSIESFMTARCPVCGGSGKVIAPSIVFSKIERDVGKVPEAKAVRLRVHPVMSGYLNAEGIKKLEKKHRKKIQVEFDWCDPQSYDISFLLKGGKEK